MTKNEPISRGPAADFCALSGSGAVRGIYRGGAEAYFLMAEHAQSSTVNSIMGMAYHSVPAPVRTGRMQECRNLKKQKRTAVRSKEMTAAFLFIFAGA